MFSFRQQRTISRPVLVGGYGYWSGQDVRVEFRPASVGAGITFVRDDLGPDARVPAQVEHRLDVPRRTNLRCQGVQVDMVEHIMAALAGLQIDNCEVGVDQQEMPGCDGSAIAFVQALDSAGTIEQSQPVNRLEITEPVCLRRGESRIEAHPSRCGGYSIEFELDYPNDPVIGRQSTTVEVTSSRFRQEIAPCRTFVLEREANEMRRRGLCGRVTPRDLLVFDDQGPIENYLRFDNECARHKTLDVIGDLALTGCEVVGHIVAYRSSHQLNAELASELVDRFLIDTPLRVVA